MLPSKFLHNSSICWKQIIKISFKISIPSKILHFIEISFGRKNPSKWKHCLRPSLSMLKASLLRSLACGFDPLTEGLKPGNKGSIFLQLATLSYIWPNYTVFLITKFTKCRLSEMKTFPFYKPISFEKILLSLFSL